MLPLLLLLTTPSFALDLRDPDPCGPDEHLAQLRAQHHVALIQGDLDFVPALGEKAGCPLPRLMCAHS